MSNLEPPKSSPPQTLPDYPPPAYSLDVLPVISAPPPPYTVAVNAAYYPPSYPQYPSNYPRHTVSYINSPNAVVTIQPVVTPAPITYRPPAHVAYSIFTMLFCCPVLGVAALVYSIKTQASINRGDTCKARQNSRMALILNHLALSIGILAITTLIIIIIFIFR